MSALDRRGFLARSGLALAAGLLSGTASTTPATSAAGQLAPGDWDGVRGLFALSPDWVHLAGLLLASHPRPVREAIEWHRRGLDDNPVHYLHENESRLEAAVLRAAAAYLGARPEEIALTDSTTMGLGLLYHALRLRPDDEILSTEHDYYATRESLDLAAARSGATRREVRLYQRPADASADEIVERIAGALTPRTRIVALTWVHSSTGVKLPIRAIAETIAAANAGREAADRALLCLDGVHGFGVEDVRVDDLGCDFFVAGTHKWLFGPRGTGFVWGREQAWPAASPIIPTFSGDESPGRLMTPGGFHSFEHRWALAEAFELHLQLGKAAVAARVHALNAQLKDGLAAMPHVTLHTPRSEELSAGLVCFDVAGLSPAAVVQRLRERRIIGSTTPYATSYARLTPGLLNTPAEVDLALDAIRALA